MVGGALSCNASGFTPGEAGAMRPWVRNLRIITPGGFLVRAERGQYVSRDGIFLFTRGTQEKPVPVPRYARPAIKNASGPYSSPDGTMDLVDLMVGSEGVFALITGCCLALSERPEEYLDLFVSLSGEQDALLLLHHLRDDLPRRFSALSACEYFGPHCREFMDHEHRFFRADHQVGVYLQVALAGKTLEEGAGEWLKIIADAPCSIDEDAVMVLLTDRDRTIFFEARHSLPANSLELVKKRGTHTIMTDTVVPPPGFEPFLAFAHDLLRSSGLDHLVFGHLGDCHLHFMIMPGKEQMDSALSVYDRIVEKSAELGGVYSGEHGTGKRKRGDFLKCHGKKAAEQILLTKSALDPNLILNPGNVVVPSLLKGPLHVPGLI
jgi:D-lactate dehydrogenase (cytochrome)